VKRNCCQNKLSVLATVVILVKIICLEYIMTGMPLESVMTYLMAEKTQILTFQLSLNILCANNLIYSNFHRKMKVSHIFNPNHMK
jgi:hypothetical protein